MATNRQGRKDQLRRAGALVTATLSLGALAPATHAASKYWDANAAAGLQGGSGTWGTDSFWSTTASGTALTSWTDGDDAFFQVGGSGANRTYTVTLNNTVTANSLTVSGDIVSLTGGTLKLGSGGLTFAGAGGVLNIASPITLTADQTWATSSIPVTVSSNISGAFSINKTGNNALVLLGSNSFTNLTLSSGILRVNSGDSLNLSGSLVLAGGIFGSGANLTVASGFAAASSTTSTIDNRTGNVTFSGNLSGAGTFQTQTTGTTANTLTFSGNNSGFTGTFNNKNGGLIFASPDAGSASGTWSSVASTGDNVALKLDFATDGIIHFGTLTVAASFLSLTTGSTNNANPATYTMEIGETGQNSTIGGAITQAGNKTMALWKAGSGTLFLTATNSNYQGATTISGGILSVASMGNASGPSSLGAPAATANTLVLDGGTLQYTGTGHTSNRLFTVTPNGGSIDASGSAPLTLSGSGSAVSSGSGARTLTLTGSGNGILTPIVGNPTVGTTSLTKSGNGAWTISGNNTYTGETRVTAGTLTLNNSATAVINSGSALNVGSGATFTDNFATGRDLTFSGLAGAGTLNTATAGNKFATGGAVAPGEAGVGTLTIAKGSLQLNNGGSYAYEIGGTTASPTSDLVNLTGTGSTVTFGGSWTLNIASLGTVDPLDKTFVLFDAQAAIASTGSWSIALPSGWAGGQIAVNPSDNTQLILTGLSVPEPGSVAVVMLGTGALLRRRRHNGGKACP